MNEIDYEVVLKKIIKPMYEDLTFPLTLADDVTKILERQVPEMVVDIRNKNQDCFCPSCSALLMVRKSDYCWRCGQKLNWDEESKPETTEKNCLNCGVAEDAYCNGCENHNKWFRKVGRE